MAKVLLVTNDFPPTVGGIQSYLRDFVDQLDPSDVVVFASTKDEEAGPSEDWLKFVRSSRARTKIRQHFAKERRLEALDRGREALTKSMRNNELPLQKMMSPELMTQVAQTLHKNDVATMYRAIGENELTTKQSQ